MIVLEKNKFLFLKGLWTIFILSFVMSIFISSKVDAEETIRVLIVEPTNPFLPDENENLQKLGVQRGEITLQGKKYSGLLEIWKGKKGLYVINELPLEEYLKGVVAGEMGSNWELEALKAQAVAARTYAMYQKLKNSKNSLFHLTSSVLHQVYRGDTIKENIVKAVEATKGEILTYEGAPILALYHSTSADMTEECFEVFGKSFPYLKPVQTNSELSPFYMWERRISVIEIQRVLKTGEIKEIKAHSQTVTGRVKDLKISTNTNELLYPAKDLRKDLGWDKLPSTHITGIDRDGDYFLFQGKGYGHGVGMCQWSALQMAKDGKTYKEILAKFYPGALLQSSQSNVNR
ncbi:MAG: SpoIID/LytB domain-containing protein [Thermodesulfovibrionales bacterium]|nr:SpoIID/LytB domain-containing protein [Thermodesulfovibrionales bacterium]